MTIRSIRQEYSKKYRKKLKKERPWVINLLYAQHRCHPTGRYANKNRKCFLTEEQVKEMWFRDKAYSLQKPSIDRINDDGDYTLENCRFIEFSENSRQGGLKSQRLYGKPKYVYSRKIIQIDGNKQTIWKSITKASIDLNITRTGISNCLAGTTKTSGGFRWKYAKEKK